MKISNAVLHTSKAFREAEVFNKILMRSLLLSAKLSSDSLSQAKQMVELDRCRMVLDTLDRSDWASDGLLIAEQHTFPALKFLNALCIIAARGKLEPLDYEWFCLFDMLGYDETLKLRYDTAAAEPIDTITPALARLAGRVQSSES